MEPGPVWWPSVLVCPCLGLYLSFGLALVPSVWVGFFFASTYSPCTTRFVGAYCLPGIGAWLGLLVMGPRGYWRFVRNLCARAWGGRK